MARIQSTFRIHEVVDVKGLNCPLPSLRTKMALSNLEPGQVVHGLATDPHSVVDFKAFCTRTGHELLDRVEGPEVFEFLLRHRRRGKPGRTTK
ncbi:MAG TPA: sulfurtransferase TusA family protein [Gammaproteobacteria bacterium]|nr:sulfurtransferase TusA family protein [Gammaproteobacteria bacterium]